MLIRNLKIVQSKKPGEENIRKIDVSALKELGIDETAIRPVYVRLEDADVEVDDSAVLMLILKKLKELEARLNKIESMG